MTELKKPFSPTIYALPVLDRQVWTNRHRPLIDRMDHHLKELVGRLEGAGDPDRPGNRGALRETFFCREALDTALATVSPAGKGVSLTVQRKHIDQLLRKKEKKTKVALPTADKLIGYFTILPTMPAEARQPRKTARKSGT